MKLHPTYYYQYSAQEFTVYTKDIPVFHYDIGTETCLARTLPIDTTTMPRTPIGFKRKNQNETT